MCNYPGCNEKKIYVSQVMADDWHIHNPSLTRENLITYKKGTVVALCRNCFNMYNDSRKQTNPIPMSSLGKLMLEIEQEKKTQKGYFIAPYKIREQATVIFGAEKHNDYLQEYFNDLTEAVLDTFPDMNRNNRAVWFNDPEQHPVANKKIGWLKPENVRNLVEIRFDSVMVWMNPNNTMLLPAISMNVDSKNHRQFLSRLTAYRCLCENWGVNTKERWIKKFLKLELPVDQFETNKKLPIEQDKEYLRKRWSKIFENTTRQEECNPVEKYFNDLAAAVVDTFPNMVSHERSVRFCNPSEHPLLEPVKQRMNEFELNQGLVTRTNNSVYAKFDLFYETLLCTRLEIKDNGEQIVVGNLTERFSKLEVYKALCKNFGVEPKESWINILSTKKNSVQPLSMGQDAKYLMEKVARALTATKTEQEKKEGPTQIDKYFYDLSTAVMETFQNTLYDGQKVYFDDPHIHPLLKKSGMIVQQCPTLIKRVNDAIYVWLNPNESCQQYAAGFRDHYENGKLVSKIPYEKLSKLTVYQTLCKNWGVNPVSSWEKILESTDESTKEEKPNPSPAEEYFNDLSEAIVDTFPNIVYDDKCVEFNDPSSHPLIQKKASLLSPELYQSLIKKTNDGRVYVWFTPSRSVSFCTIHLCRTLKGETKELIEYFSRLVAYKTLCEGWGVEPKEKWIEKFTNRKEDIGNGKYILNNYLAGNKPALYI